MYGPTKTPADMGFPYDAVLSDSLGYWPLQDDAANTLVLNRTGSDGTLSGGNNTEDLSVAGPGSGFAKALDFDALADFVTQSRVTSGAVSALTVGAVIQAPPTGGNRTIASEADFANNARQWQFAVNTTNKLQGWVNAGGDAGTLWRRVDSNAALTAGQWYWVAMTFDGSVGDGLLTLYSGGSVLASTLGSAGVCNAIYNGSAPFRIGAATTTGSAGVNFYNGPIAGVAVWDRVLEPEELAALAL